MEQMDEAQLNAKNEVEQISKRLPSLRSTNENQQQKVNERRNSLITLQTEINTFHQYENQIEDLTREIQKQAETIQNLEKMIDVL